MAKRITAKEARAIITGDDEDVLDRLKENSLQTNLDCAYELIRAQIHHKKRRSIDMSPTIPPEYTKYALAVFGSLWFCTSQDGIVVLSNTTNTFMHQLVVEDGFTVTIRKEWGTIGSTSGKTFLPVFSISW